MKTRLPIRWGFRWLAGCCLLGAVAANAQSPSPAESKGGVLLAPSGASMRRVVRTAGTSFGSRPLTFEANQGQSGSAARYLAHGQGYSLFLRPDEADFALRTSDVGGKNVRSAQVKMRLAGSDPAARFVAPQALPGQVNYFVGNDPKHWRTHIPTFARLRCNGVYPGIDMVYYGNQRQLEYDFVVAPKANPTAIQIDFAGAQKTRIATDGSLHVVTAAGELRWGKPVVYQEINGKRRTVAAHFTTSRGKRPTIGFAVAAYDNHRPLIIDPTLIFSTYMGGFGTGNNGKEEGHAITSDRNNNVYVTGYSDSPDFPVIHHGSPDAFIAKFGPDGALLYVSYLGGEGYEIGSGIVVDLSGNAVVTGLTNSFTFPVTANAFQNARHTPGFPANSGFLTKLSADGASLLYSTYICDTLSNNSETVSNAIALDAYGAVYVTGYTGARAFPVRHAYQSSPGYVPTMFIAKYNTNAVLADDSLVYATYVGGLSYGNGRGIAVDGSGAAYVVGTGSVEFTRTANALPAVAGGNGGIVIVKLNATGESLLTSTHFGGSSYEVPTGLTLDTSNNLYISGYTTSTDFPHTPNAFQTNLRGGEDAFITKMNLTQVATTLVYSTYLGTDSGAFGIAVDGAGCAWITGDTSDRTFPLAFPVQSVNRSIATQEMSASNAYVARLSPDGSQLLFSTYLGGTGHDSALAIALDSNRNALITGMTLSTDFPVLHPYQSTLHGYADIFVAKIKAQIADLELTHTANPLSIAGGDRVTFSSQIINHGPDDATNVLFLEALTRAYDPDAPFDTVVVDAVTATHRANPIVQAVDNHHFTALVPVIPAFDRAQYSLIVTTSRPIADGYITSAVSESSDASDPNPDNNRPATITVAVTLPIAPRISTLNPNNATAGGPAFDLTVTGSNFRSGASVNWNGTARTTTFISPTQLTAHINASDIALAGSANVTVVNPGSILSNAAPFFIGTPFLRVSLLSATRSGGFYHLRIQVLNVGTADAVSVAILGATLGGVSPTTTPLPTLGRIAVSASGIAVLDFPLTAGAPGSTVLLTFRAGYSTGVLNSTQRLFLP